MEHAVAQREMTTPRKRLAGRAEPADARCFESNPLHANSRGGSYVYPFDLVLAWERDSTFFGNVTWYRRDTAPCVDDKLIVQNQACLITDEEVRV